MWVVGLLVVAAVWLIVRSIATFWPYLVGIVAVLALGVFYSYRFGENSRWRPPKSLTDAERYKLTQRELRSLARQTRRNMRRRASGRPTHQLKVRPELLPPPAYAFPAYRGGRVGIIVNLTTRGMGVVSCVWLVFWLLEKQQATDAANRAAGSGDVPPYAVLALVPSAIGLAIAWSMFKYVRNRFGI